MGVGIRAEISQVSSRRCHCSLKKKKSEFQFSRFLYCRAIRAFTMLVETECSRTDRGRGVLSKLYWAEFLSQQSVKETWQVLRFLWESYSNDGRGRKWGAHWCFAALAGKAIDQEGQGSLTLALSVELSAGWG